MFKLRRAILVAIMLFSTSAFAQSANMVGYGLSKCSAIVEMVTQDQSRTIVLMHWVFGYVSGLNTLNIVKYGKYRDVGAVVQDGKAGAITIPLLRGCQDNPNRDFADMVGEIYSQLPLREFKKH